MMEKLGPAEKLLSAALILIVMGQYIPWYILTVVIAGAVLYWYRSTKYEFKHWTRMGVAGPGAAQPFPQALFFESSTDALKFDNDNTTKYGSIFGYHAFGSRVLSVSDPELLKRIFIKDFDHFVNRGDERLFGKYSLMGKMFSLQTDQRWKSLRNTLTPAFTSGKMKQMPYYINQSLESLDQVIMDYVNRGEEVPLKNTIGRFTLDTVAVVSFALNIEAQTREDNPFVVHSKNLINISFSDPGLYIQVLAPNLANLFTYYTGIAVSKNESEQFFYRSVRPIIEQRRLNPIAQTREDNPFVVHSKNLINISFSDPGLYIQVLAPNLANLFTYYTGIAVSKNESEQFFYRSVRPIIEQRRLNPIARPDFLQLCLNSQKEKGNENIEHDAEIMFEDYKKAAKAHMTDDELIAQSALFLAVGFESTAAVLEFITYLLATHPEVQEKCRQEIREKCGMDSSMFTFDQIMHLEYVSAVLCETLRKYPVSYRAMRLCNKDVTYPDYGITIKKGDSITVPVYHIHHDPANYHEPEQFIPERFLGDAKSSRDPYTYLPFGVGPRNCIGMRFAQLEILQMIAHVLSKYRLMPCGDTPPLNLDVTIVLKPKDGMKIKICPI